MISEKHHRQAGLFRRRPEPVVFAIGEMFRQFAGDVETHAQHVVGVAQGGEAFGLLRVVEINARHGGEATGKSACGLEAVIISPAFKGRRYDDNAIDIALRDDGRDALDRHGLGQLRLRAGRPGAVWRVGFPQVNLRIDDQAFARGLRKQ